MNNNGLNRIILVTKDGYGVTVHISDEDLKTLKFQLDRGDSVTEIEEED